MIIKLGKVISEYSVRNKADEDIPVYSVTNDKGFCTNYFSKDVSSKDRTTYKIVPYGYFAYNPSRINVGSVDWQHYEKKVIVSPLYVVFYVDEVIDQRYLLHYLKSDITLKFIKSNSAGSVRDNLKLSVLQEFSINLRTKEEQYKIVNILDKVDLLISLYTEKLKKFDDLTKSLFIEMFGDPVENPKKWDIIQLHDRCDIVTGNTPAREKSEYYGNYIEWIKSDNINTDDMYLTVAEEYLSKKGLLVGRCVEAGSILMTCIAGSIGCIGNVGVANRKVAFNQQINAIVPNKDSNIFIYWLMVLSKKYIQGTVNMSLKGILSKGKLSELYFPFPPIELQHKFEKNAIVIDKSKLAVKKSLEELEILKKSLMQKYFA